MEEFLEFTTTLDDVSVASPKQGYSLSVVRSAVVTYDVGNASARQTSEEVNCDVIEVIGTLKTASRVVQMYLDTATLRGNKSYKVVFSAETGSGGPYTVTFSTGIALRKNVVVLVPSAGKSPVMFDLYVDKVGNVVSSSIGAALIGSGLSKNDIVGLTCSNAADADHDITIAAGYALDSTGMVALLLSSAITKSIDASWAAGTNAGGLFSGSVAANTVYYLFLIRKDLDGSIDAGWDTSATAANRPAGYTAYRMIRRHVTDASANIIPTKQTGDYVTFNNPIQNRAPGVVASANRIAYAASVPPNCAALLSLVYYHVGAVAGRYIWWGSFSRTDTTASPTNFSGYLYITSVPITVETNILTDASSQFFARCSNTDVYFGYWTLGWIDDRGKDA